MAFGRLERRTPPAPMSEINMTPLIDVMLVLLVIFMVTAPLMASNLRLELPEGPAARADEAPPALRVAITADGALHLDDQPIALDALAAELKTVAARRKDAEVQLRADKAVPYGRVAELIGRVQAAGLTRIGFVTETVPGTP
ncbi:ExbD/TolR family protein [Rivibacter subsaxonicus]|uniref:Biopolymer transport protein ExbD/biopolymer transport protein TolR n=1 Tax=Rivibacter subsaxonicus TaxID=457575 RepID=A0A4Q7VVP7_9BURK|nr:biopolymer transporter ExbD [Rivibacter subsaxonicus]RZU00663.1 biopolymer transport protein ExbD/biopolymer transport protein TolR [Rivibacter subsaxonicus]